MESQRNSAMAHLKGPMAMTTSGVKKDTLNRVDVETHGQITSAAASVNRFSAGKNNNGQSLNSPMVAYFAKRSKT